MIKTSIAKSKMENEEGMNHLLIEIPPLDVQEAQVSIVLPSGIFRIQNLNGYIENESGSIFIDNRTKWTQQLLIEIYTKEVLHFGIEIIGIVLALKENDKTTRKITDSVEVIIADEDDVDTMVIDENVITFLKNLQNDKDENDIPQPRTFKTANEYSFLEEEYRVDF